MPPGLEIQRVADDDALARAAAGLFVRLARKAIADRGTFVVALSGGSTPRRMFEALAAAPLEDRVAWDRIDFFFSDERAVPPEHGDSNYRLARETLFDAVAVSSDRVHRMKAEVPDLSEAADAYSREIATVFEVSTSGPPPAFDLILLGMGADGHTASLFPHTEALHAAGWVAANPVPALAAQRMTMTPAIINRAACVALLVSGAEKAHAVAEVLEGAADPDRLPSQRIRPESGRLVWLVDRAAAAGLKGQAAREVRLAPSILSADFARLGEHVDEAARAGADRLHVDVMDGHFVANISIGTVVVRSLRKATHLPLETHLMITDPDTYAEPFAEAGSDRIIFHQEACADPLRLAEQIRDMGVSPGIVINPDTPAATIEGIIPHVDLALLMTVHPGFGGQKFIDDVLPKIAEVRAVIDREHPTCDLEIDGGVDSRTAPRAVEAGARVLVAGSAIFDGEGSVDEAMQRIRQAATPAAVH